MDAYHPFIFCSRASSSACSWKLHFRLSSSVSLLPFSSLFYITSRSPMTVYIRSIIACILHHSLAGCALEMFFLAVCFAGQFPLILFWKALARSGPWARMTFRCGRETRSVTDHANVTVAATPSALARAAEPCCFGRGIKSGRFSISLFFLAPMAAH